MLYCSFCSGGAPLRLITMITKNLNKSSIVISVLLVLFFGLRFGIGFCAEPSASQQQRTQELLEEEKLLRERLDKEEKIYIKGIKLEGITLLDKELLDEITQPFKKHLLSKEEIRHLIELIKQAYQDKGYTGHPAEISYEIKDNYLKIRVDEITL